MKLYNTLTRCKEEFKPISGNEVRIYSCGPTVYEHAHIGNLRTYIFMDILRRTLRYSGFTLLHVMNITDVGHLVSDADAGEDKMVKAAKESHKDPWEIARHFTGIFFEDIAQLNIETPEIVPRATAHIPEMIAFVQELVEKGYGYEISDGIYFDISKFKGYGKLSRLDLEQQIAGARVEVNEEKRNPADFALWKKAHREHIMQWPSPWGMGFPGWHIECSAMSRKYLGDCFDIHTGGVDHIPVHHENEIAQSEALLGKPAVNVWMHADFLLIDNGKMSKSLRNIYTVADLKSRGFNPLAYRYFCLNAHYRSKLNFTWDGLAAAQKSLDRFYEGAFLMKGGTDYVDPEALKAFKMEFDESVSDDLNVPRALGVAWNVVRYGKRSQKLYELLLQFDSILGLNVKGFEPKQPEDAVAELSPEISELVEQRLQARKEKDYRLADEIRRKLGDLGYVLEDTPRGINVTRKTNGINVNKDNSDNKDNSNNKDTGKI